MFTIKPTLIRLALSSPIFFSIVAYGSGYITLENITSCKVTMKGMQIVKTETVPAVEVSSFYFTTPQDINSATYDTTIQPGASGAAIVGDYNPFTPVLVPTFAIGFSRSPGYNVGSTVIGLSGSGPTYGTRYIYQYIDLSLGSSFYCSQWPCLTVANANPCGH